MMSNVSDEVLYSDTPIRARMVAHLLLGAGGLVLAPIGLLSGARWLLVLAAPTLLVGIMLRQLHLRIEVELDTGMVTVTRSVLGLRLRRRRYSLSDVVGLELQRVAAIERERPSDTWYLKLELNLPHAADTVHPRTRVYTIGKYDDRLTALKVQHNVRETLDL
jgi:hypothetical protein